MKILFDLLPLIAFFAAYSLPERMGGGIYLATAAAMVVGVIQIAWQWLRHRRVDRMLLASTALLVVLGGITLILHDPVFIKWKPTAVYGLFAIAFVGSEWLTGKSLIRRAMESQIVLEDRHWRRLNLAWAGFFATLGALNLIVAYSFDEQTWVRFKVFGLFGLMLLFVLAQSVWLMRHAREPGTDG
ncbi:MAG: septation protein A [Gammaproteobacteria bacterium]